MVSKVCDANLCCINPKRKHSQNSEQQSREAQQKRQRTNINKDENYVNRCVRAPTT